jgi:hypothetical protein
MSRRLRRWNWGGSQTVADLTPEQCRLRADRAVPIAGRPHLIHRGQRTYSETARAGKRALGAKPGHNEAVRLSRDRPKMDLVALHSKLNLGGARGGPQNSRLVEWGPRDYDAELASLNGQIEASLDA